MSLHYPVDRVSTLNFGTGFLCNCGRTVVGEARVGDHFGKPYKQVWEDLYARRESTQADESGTESTS